MEVEAKRKVKLDARTVSIYLKVSDQFYCQLFDQNKNCLKEHDGYVPGFMPGEHYGDYVDLIIDIETGNILNWRSPEEMQDKISQFLVDEE